jgi:Tfp pilus assembly protein PilO
MSPMILRVLAEKRLAVIGVAVALVLNLGAYFAVVRPLAIKSTGAADRAKAATAEKAAAEAELNQARSLVSGKNDAEQELNAFYQKVLPADIIAARRMTYATLPALARKAGVQYDTRTWTIVEPTDKTTLARMQIKMTLRGDYASLREFVYELERSSDFVIIDDVSLNESRPNEEITLSINLSTYYRVPHGS